MNISVRMRGGREEKKAADSRGRRGGREKFTKEPFVRVNTWLSISEERLG